MCSISYSLCYAAPEVVQALEEGKHTLVVDAAVDIWALGVIACALDSTFGTKQLLQTSARRLCPLHNVADKNKTGNLARAAYEAVAI